MTSERLVMHKCLGGTGMKLTIQNSNRAEAEVQRNLLKKKVKAGGSTVRV